MSKSTMICGLPVFLLIGLLSSLLLLQATSTAMPLEDSPLSEEKRTVMDYLSYLEQRGLDSEGAHFEAPKRFKPPRQNRSGGMSLCLWKVCPAAPWLLTKK